MPTLNPFYLNAEDYELLRERAEASGLSFAAATAGLIRAAVRAGLAPEPPKPNRRAKAKTPEAPPDPIGAVLGASNAPLAADTIAGRSGMPLPAVKLGLEYLRAKGLVESANAPDGTTFWVPTKRGLSTWAADGVDERDTHNG